MTKGKSLGQHVCTAVHLPFDRLRANVVGCVALLL
jgi:hypothetical protein